MKRFLYLILFIFVLLSPTETRAANVSISNFSPSTISSQDTEVTANVNLAINYDDGTIYYLRGVFSKDGSDNYCGYTWNGSEWFKGPYSSDEGWKKFLKVTVASGSATATIKAKLDATDAGCKDSGTYKFKIQRFTVSGSGSYDDQTAQTLTATFPSLTPTPNPTASPTQTPTPGPTSTPNPTSKPTSAPTKKPTPTDKITPTDEPTETPEPEVLGSESEISPTSTPAKGKGIGGVIVPIFVVLGLGCLGFAGFSVYKEMKKPKDIV
jgi:hypothetical protein